MPSPIAGKSFPPAPSRRYADKRLAAIYTTSRLLDPYNRNTYKGDYPLIGRRLFFAVTAVSETTAEARRIPVPSVASSTDPGEFDFFGRGEQSRFQQNFRIGFDIFRGSAGFEPVDLEFHITPEFNINYAVARENGLIAIDVRPRHAPHRYRDRHAGSSSSRSVFSPARRTIDFTSLRVGIQRFTSDFRGLIFSDEQPGARLFGNFHNNVFQYNLAYFNLLEKDANSGLNHWQSRRQSGLRGQSLLERFPHQGLQPEFQRALQSRSAQLPGGQKRLPGSSAPRLAVPRAAQGARRLCGHLRRRPHRAHQRLARFLPGLRPRRFQPDSRTEKSAAHQRATGLRRGWLREGLDGVEGQLFYTSGDEKLERRPRQRLRRHRAQPANSPAAASSATRRSPTAA